MKKTIFIVLIMNILSGPSVALTPTLPQPDASKFDVICATQEGYTVPLYSIFGLPNVNELFLKSGVLSFKGSLLYRIANGKIYRSDPAAGMPEEEFGEIKSAAGGHYISVGHNNQYSAYIGDNKRLGNTGTLLFDFSFGYNSDGITKQPLIGTVVNADAISVTVAGLKCSKGKAD